MQRRVVTLFAGSALVLAACGGGDDEATGSPATTAAESGSAATTDGGDGNADDEATNDAPESADEPAPDAAGPFEVEQIASSEPNIVQSGLSAFFDRNVPDDFPEPTVALDELRSGGPPPDGIPPIDTPKFVRAAEVTDLADQEPVLALEIDGEARAYPVRIMTWHEIVNDTVGGVPVSVTYCPLCNSAVAYDRRLDDGRIVDFGTSGLLWNSALVMYDRQTETLWSHFTGSGMIGELTGVELDDFPLSTVGWGTWRDANPDGLVLSEDTGFSRDYGRNPYPGYDDVDGIPFLFQGEVDGRFTAMTRIIGIERDGAALGVPLFELQEARVLTAQIGELDLVTWWTPGTASALDTASIEAGADVGATGVFIPVVDGQELTFTSADDELFVDDQTGSTWNVLGDAIDGPLAGSQLEAISHVDTFWFAWSTFRPDTEVRTG